MGWQKMRTMEGYPILVKQDSKGIRIIPLLTVPMTAVLVFMVGLVLWAMVTGDAR